MQASSSTPPLRPKAKLMAQTAGDSPHCICASLSVNSPSNSPFRLNSPAQLAASPLAIRVALTAVTPPPAAASPIPIEPRSASCPPEVRFLPPAVRRLQEEQRTRLEQETRFADERARLRRAAGSPLKRGGGSPLRNVTTFTVLLDEPPEEAVGDSDGGGDDDDEVDDSSPPCSFSPTGSPPESTGILFRPKAVSPKASRKTDETPPAER